MVVWPWNVGVFIYAYVYVYFYILFYSFYDFLNILSVCKRRACMQSNKGLNCLLNVLNIRWIFITLNLNSLKKHLNVLQHQHLFIFVKSNYVFMLSITYLLCVLTYDTYMFISVYAFNISFHRNNNKIPQNCHLRVVVW